MKSKNLFVLLAVIIVIIIVYSFVGSESDQNYINKIEAQRSEKDHYMRTSPESPFAGNTNNFEGLKYYPVKPSFRINATLTPASDKSTVILPTSDGKESRYLKYAYADFDLQDRHNKLLILEIMEKGPTRGTLFVAFGDATSGGETYGAGRYLEVKKVPGAASITLDFNEAYNPYCAYNEAFSCPLPPRENLLQVAIEAGEKNYQPH